MNLSFAALEPGISSQLATAQILKPATVKKLVTTQLLPHKDRFLAVEAVTGVPAIWLMPVWYREKPSFNSYFGNGDPLGEVTTHVPVDRGPFATWEDGVIDALNVDHITHVDDWSWPRMTYQWESWNGFGPRNHGRTSGYIWSGTDQYHGGKFVHDGPSGWSPGTWDMQIGCYAIAKIIADEDPSIAGALVS